MSSELEREFITLRRQVIEASFGRLNPVQREAVFTVNGPLLISRAQAAARPPCWSTGSPIWCDSAPHMTVTKSSAV